MYSPRPPAPIAAAMVADPTPTTAATRIPATIEGIASGSSTWRSSSLRVMPIAVPAPRIDRAAPRPLAHHLPWSHAQRGTRVANRPIGPLQTGDPRSDDRQQPIQDQHDDCGARTNAAEQRDRQQKSEHRQARNGLHEVRDSHERRAETRTARRKDAERHPSSNSDEGGDATDKHVLPDQAGQLGAVRQPELKDV